MSTPLYLVAYRTLYRHNPYDLPPRLPDRMFLKGFTRREDAEAFLKAQPLPFHINPFGDTVAFVSINGELCTFQRDDDSDSMPLTEFCTWIESLGLAPPPFAPPQKKRWELSEMAAADALLYQWWEEQYPQMSEEQRHAIWSWCDPMPWEIVEVALEGKP